jgi:hypothetical protein
MSIESALVSLRSERRRLEDELARVDEAIAALEALGPTAGTKAPKRPKKVDGRSAPKPPVVCPFCGETAKGMAGLAAHVRGSHPDRYPDAYNEWKRQRAAS